jgi:hypothetical protein
MTAKWIGFQLEERRSGAKTDTWHVWSLKEPRAHLGIVKWYGGWAKYVFFPGAATLYEEDCLRDLAAFIEAETLKQRKGRRAMA